MQKQYDANHQHLVCLMYHPGVLLPFKADLQNRYFKFNCGFKALSQRPNVALFAAEYELTQCYRTMLGNVIGTHPCGLISQQQFEDIQLQKKLCPQVLLYVGDAKVNKGFLALPDLLESLVETIFDENVKFLIQYTITNNSVDLAAVDKTLKQWALKDKRIAIQDDFLTEQAMHQLWLQTTDVVFNYDEAAYRYQSSGVLWQAAAYNANIYLMTDSWLNREAKRLGCHYWYAKTWSQLQTYLQNNIENFHQVEMNTSDKKNEYRNNLFSDLTSWLVTNISQNKGNKTWNI